MPGPTHLSDGHIRAQNGSNVTAYGYYSKVVYIWLKRTKVFETFSGTFMVRFAKYLNILILRNKPFYSLYGVDAIYFKVKRILVDHFTLSEEDTDIE